MKEVSVAPPSPPGAGRRGYAQPRPQGFSPQKWVGREKGKALDFFKGKALGTRLGYA